MTPIKSLQDLLGFPFRSPDWKNSFLIGSGLIIAGSFIPIIPLFFVLGYSLQVMRQTIQGQEPVMPDWTNWSKLLTDGLRRFAISLVFLAPGMAIMIAGMVIYMGSSMAMPFMIEPNNRSAVGGTFLLIFGSMIIMMIAMFLGMLLTFLGSLPLPAATAHFVAQDKVSAAFRIREWWPLIARNKMGYFAAWVVSAGVMAVMYIAVMLVYSTMILCFLLPFVSAPLMFYLFLIYDAVFGQVYRESSANAQGEALPTPPTGPAIVLAP